MFSTVPELTEYYYLQDDFSSGQTSGLLFTFNQDWVSRDIYILKINTCNVNYKA